MSFTIHILCERIVELELEINHLGGCGCDGCVPNYHALINEEDDLWHHVTAHETLAKRLMVEELPLPTDLCRRIAIFADLPASCPQLPAILETLRAPGSGGAAVKALNSNMSFEARRDHAFYMELSSLRCHHYYY